MSFFEILHIARYFILGIALVGFVVGEILLIHRRKKNRDSPKTTK